MSCNFTLSTVNYRSKRQVRHLTLPVWLPHPFHDVVVLKLSAARTANETITDTPFYDVILKPSAARTAKRNNNERCRPHHTPLRLARHHTTPHSLRCYVGKPIKCAEAFTCTLYMKTIFRVLAGDPQAAWGELLPEAAILEAGATTVELAKRRCFALSVGDVSSEWSQFSPTVVQKWVFHWCLVWKNGRVVRLHERCGAVSSLCNV